MMSNTSKSGQTIVEYVVVGGILGVRQAKEQEVK